MPEHIFSKIMANPLKAPAFVKIKIPNYKLTRSDSIKIIDEGEGCFTERVR